MEPGKAGELVLHDGMYYMMVHVYLCVLHDGTRVPVWIT